MKLIIAAVGRLKAGPERELSARYVERSIASCRAIGLTGFEVREIDESRARRMEDRRADEARAPQVGAHERGSAKVSALEIRALEMRAGQVHADQAGALEGGRRQLAESRARLGCHDAPALANSLSALVQSSAPI